MESNKNIEPDLSKNINLGASIDDIIRHLCSRGEFDFFGLKMSQVPKALLYLSTLLQLTKPNKILEFGTDKGGLSVLLSIYAKINKVKFLTYDLKGYTEEYKDYIGFSFIEADLLNSEVQNGIIEEIKETNGKNLLICDALKSEEFKLYSPYLKSGDMIIMHDYSRTYNSKEWARDSNFHGWSAPQEQWYGNIEESCKKNNIVPFMHNDFEHVLWFCGVKK